MNPLLSRTYRRPGIPGLEEIMLDEEEWERRVMIVIEPLDEEDNRRQQGCCDNITAGYTLFKLGEDTSSSKAANTSLQVDEQLYPKVVCIE